MALFIAGLAFEQQQFKDSSTIAIMLASLISASIGAFLAYTGRAKDTSTTE
jgi:Na+/H+ antiporter NhaA